MMYSRAKKSVFRTFPLVLHLLVISSLLLGSLSTVMAQDLPGGVTAQTEIEPFEIAQGGSIHQNISAGERLIFELDLKSSGAGSKYNWEILNPPVHGQVGVREEGVKAEVTYTPEAEYSGTDLFSVQVSDAEGHSDKIGIVVDVNSSPNLNKTQHPFSLSPSEQKTVDLGGQRTAGQNMPEVQPVLPLSDESVVDSSNYWYQGMSGSQTPTSGQFYPFLSIEKDSPVELGNADHQLEATKFAEPPSLTDIGGSIEAGTSYISVESLSLIHGTGWPIGATITLTVDDPSNGPGVDYSDSLVSDNTQIYFWVSSYTMAAGFIVTISDGITTKSHTIRNLTVTSVNFAEDTVSGTAAPGSEASVWAFAYSGPPSSSRNVVTDSNGNWIADFSAGPDVTDIVAGFYGGVSQYDEDGDSSFVRWDTFIPSLVADLDSNVIYGNKWMKGDKTFTLTIDDPSTGVGIDYSDTYSINEEPSLTNYAYFTFTLENFDLTAGQNITMTDGETTKTHVVSSLKVITTDTETDTLIGIADLGEISVYACDNSNCEWLYPMTDESGDWSANFSGLVDIAVGSHGRAYQEDNDGDSTRVNWSIPSSHFVVYPEGNEIEGYEWAPNSLVTLTIGADEYVDSALSNGDGYVYFNASPFDIVPGQVIKLTDSSFEKTHTVLDFTITDIDQETDTVSGTAEAGSMVNVGACDFIACEWQQPTADGGIWSVNFTGLVNIAPGSYGGAHQWDDDGDITSINWSIPNPGFTVNLNRNYIWGYGWTPETIVTLNVRGIDVTTATSEPGGNIYIDTSSYNILPGDTVTVSDANTTKTLLVQNLALTGVDPVLDTVTGTADPGSALNVSACDRDPCANIDLNTGDSGIWVANFADIEADLVPGSFGYAQLYDEDGDYTEVRWSVPNPSFEAKPENDAVWGWEWPAFAEIKLTINGDEYYRTSNEIGDVDFGNLQRDLVVGDYLEMSYGTTVKTHTVLPLEVTNINIVDNIVSGTAEPGGSLWVWACANGDCPGFSTSADTVTGNWEVDFTGVLDIVPGTEGGMQVWDEDNDATTVYWYIPNPVFDVRPGEESVQGWKWLPNAEVTISVGGNNFTIWTDNSGYFGTGTLDYDIQTGDQVQVTDGTYLKDHTVYHSELTDFSLEEDTLSGKAEPDRAVGAWVCTSGSCDSLTTTTDGSGYWTLNFSGIVDIAPGSDGGIWQPDDDNDNTVTSWHIPNPSFTVNLLDNSVRGWEWPAETDITLTFGSFTRTETSNLNGDVNFNSIPFDIQPGDLIQVSDGITTKYHTVLLLGFDGYDEIDDLLSGSSEPLTWVNGWGCDNVICEGTGADTDEAGNFIIYFNDLDIKPGTSGIIDRGDIDGDYTEISWHVPNPAFDVNPEEDTVWGWEWPAETEVTFTFGSFTDTRTSNENGDVDFGYLGIDFKVGDYLEMTDGITTKDHTIRALSLSNIDSETNILTGITDPGEWVYAWACVDGNCPGLSTMADQVTGIWSVDFTGVMDIVPGMDGGFRRGDEENDGTTIGWRIPKPLFVVNLNEDRVWCNRWSSYAALTLNIDGVDVATLTTDYWGFAEFLDFDIQPGQTVIVRDGTYQKAHLVRNLEVTDIDPVLDTVSGTAEIGSVLQVRACNEITCEFVFPVVEEDGNWVADYSGVWDLVPGNDGFAQVIDDDRDFTEIHWGVPIPSIGVNPLENTVRGWDFNRGATVTLTIGSFSRSLTADENGYVNFELSSAPFDILPTQVVVVSDGQTTKSHTVRNIAVTAFDLESDDVSGTAIADSEVFVVAFDDVSSGTGLNISVDTLGKWSADFTGTEDITFGTWGWVDQTDDDGDWTTVDWEVPPPEFSVSGNITDSGLNPITGIIVSDGFGHSSITDATGAYTITGLIAGTYVLTPVKNGYTFNPTSREVVINDTDILDVNFTSMDPPPILKSPIAGSTVRGTPTYSWVTVGRAATYVFQYDDNSDFSSPVFTSNELINTSFTPPLQAVGTYYWHVKARDAENNWSKWSVNRKITIKPIIPIAPILSAPASNSFTMDNTPTLSWKSVPYGYKYQVQISKSSTFATREQDKILSPGLLKMTALSLIDGKHYWRVRAINTLNENGAWSIVRNFTVDTIAPAVPVLSAPASGATVTGIPTYKWLAVTGAKYYQLAYSKTPTFSSGVYTSALLNVLYFKPLTQAAGTYYWHVRVQDKAGNWSKWSPARKIIIK